MNRNGFVIVINKLTGFIHRGHRSKRKNASNNNSDDDKKKTLKTWLNQKALNFRFPFWYFYSLLCTPIFSILLTATETHRVWMGERDARERVSKGEFIKSGNTCSIGDKGNILRHFCVHSVWPSSCSNACKWHCFSRSDLLCAHTRKRIHSNRSFCILLQWMIVATNFQKIFFLLPFEILLLPIHRSTLLCCSSLYWIFCFFLSMLNAFFLSSLLIMILLGWLLFFFRGLGKSNSW